jgi:Zn-dependent metalloprotease
MTILLFLSALTTSVTNIANAEVIPPIYNGPKFVFNKPILKIDRFEDAYETLQSDPGIKKILKDKSHALMPKKKVINMGIETTKFQHFYKGVEVVGSNAAKHSTGLQTEINNRISEFDLDVRPTVDEQTATSLARSYIGKTATVQKPILKIWPRSKGSARLVYQIPTASNKFKGKDLIIDAQTGQLIAELPHQLEIAPVTVLSAKEKIVRLPDNLPEDPDKLPPGLAKEIEAACQGVDLEGAPVFMNPPNCKMIFNKDQQVNQPDSSASNAQKNARMVLEYYSKNFKRDSFDGKGTEVNSIVHIGDNFPNAFWFQQMNLMAYGDGDGKIFGDFTEALDVAGHEMTHGVVGNPVDGPQLLPMGESGALNEAYADFFGKMVENQNNWVIGHTIAKSARKAGFRDLANPRSMDAVLPPEEEGGFPIIIPYPAHMQEMLPTRGPCRQENDSCWVHVNATIPGHASYLVVQAIGAEKAQNIYYTTLTHFLDEASTFDDAATYTLRACAQLYKNGTTCQKVKEAFAQVGL